MLETRDPKGIETINRLKTQGYPIAFVGDVVGTGSSRKSAINSLLWHIGDDIPYIPNLGIWVPKMQENREKAQKLDFHFFKHFSIRVLHSFPYFSLLHYVRHEVFH